MRPLNNCGKRRTTAGSAFCNQDPFTEPETSSARMEYEARRSATGQLEIRLFSRDGSFFDHPEAWEAAPLRFLNAWEQAWVDCQMSDHRT